jgi:hypothetical protein
MADIEARRGFTPSTDAALQLLADRYGIAPAEVLNVRVTQNGYEPFARYQPELMIYPDEKIDPEQLRERASRLLATADRLEQERAAAGDYGLGVPPEQERVTYDDGTLDKVRAGLSKAITGLTWRSAAEIIAAMQNEGILFRERAPEPPSCGHMGCHLTYDQSGANVCTFLAPEHEA